MGPTGYTGNINYKNHGQINTSMPAQNAQHVRTSSATQQQYGTYQQQPESNYRNTQNWYNSVGQTQPTQETPGALNSFVATNQPRIANTSNYTTPATKQQYSYHTAQGSSSGAVANHSYSEQTQSGYTAPSNYAQPQQRPDSVGSNRNTRQPSRTHQTQTQNTNYYQPQQATQHQQVAQALTSGVDRSVSPAQIQASRQLQSLQSGARASNQQSQTNQHTTIDPSSVYDPWPEYQRQREVQAAKEQAEASARAEGEAAEKARQAIADKMKRAEEERKVRLQAEADERRAKEAEDRKKADKAAKAKARRAEKKQAQQQSLSQTPPAQSSGFPNMSTMGGEEPAEGEIRLLMSKIREMSGKHPSLLAKIWEQERQSYLKDGTPSKGQASSAVTPSPVPVPAPSRGKYSAPPTPRPAQQVPARNTGSPAMPPPAVRTPGVPPRKTQWPEDKLQQVTTAAIVWLARSPENASILLERETFLAILNGNPTYIELCERLEQMGFKVDRAQFALAIKKVMDEDSTNVTRPNVGRKVTATARLHASPPRAVFQPSRTQQGYAPPAAPSWGSSITGGSRTPGSPYDPMEWQPTSFENYPSPPAAAIRQPPGVSSEKQPSPAPSGPVSKIDAARKRKIDDLIDLTALSDDDDLPPPPKKSFHFKTYNAPAPYGVPQSQTSLQQSINTANHFLTGAVAFPAASQALQNQQAAPTSTNPPTALQLLQNRRALLLEDKCRNVVIAQQLDMKKVKRRSGYNPATIARDVLLATGKHPDLGPLNGHLEVLKMTLAKLGPPAHRIDGMTDLGTIRWDLIDPGKPVQLKNIAVEKSDDEEFMEVDDYAGDDSPLVSQKKVAEASSRVHVAQPTPNARASINENATAVHVAPLKPSTVIMSKSIFGPTPKRRGRPPRVSDPGASQSLSASDSKMYAPSKSSSKTPEPSKAKAKTPASSSGLATGYSAFKAAQSSNGEPVIKKRGRPVGWRKHLHLKGGVEKGYTPSSLRSRLDASPDPKYTFVKRIVFDCMWAGCPARLHNLDTLRKHVRKVHGQSDKSGVLECKWEGCGKAVTIRIPETGQLGTKIQHNSFGAVDAWSNHIEQSHIGPVSWAKGDGPRDGFMGESDGE